MKNNYSSIIDTAKTLKGRNSPGAGGFTALGGAVKETLKERFDPRNMLFKREGLLATLFPAFRGYKAGDKGRNERVQSSTNDRLSGFGSDFSDQLDASLLIQSMEKGIQSISIDMSTLDVISGWLENIAQNVELLTIHLTDSAASTQDMMGASRTNKDAKATQRGASEQPGGQKEKKLKLGSLLGAFSSLPSLKQIFALKLLLGLAKTGEGAKAGLQAMGEGLSFLGEGLKSVAEPIKVMADAFSEFMGSLIKGAIGIGLMALAIWGIAKAFKEFADVSWLDVAAGIVFVVGIALGANAAAVPLLIAAGALAAFGAGLWLVAKGFEALGAVGGGKIFGDLVDWFKTFFLDVGAWFKESFDGIIKWFSSTIASITDWIGSIGPRFMDMFSSLATWFTDKFAVIGTWFTDLFKMFEGWFEKIKNVGDWFSTKKEEKASAPTGDQAPVKETPKVAEAQAPVKETPKVAEAQAPVKETPKVAAVLGLKDTEAVVSPIRNGVLGAPIDAPQSPGVPTQQTTPELTPDQKDHLAIIKRLGLNPDKEAEFIQKMMAKSPEQLAEMDAKAMVDAKNAPAFPRVRMFASDLAPVTPQSGSGGSPTVNAPTTNSSTTVVNNNSSMVMPAPPPRNSEPTINLSWLRSLAPF